MKSLWRPRLLLLLCPFLLLAPVWLAGQALYWGTPSTQFIPWWWQAWQTIQAGEWPLWNPMVGMGAPLLANYQSALLYPPTWIYFGLAALGGLPLMAWGQAIVVALHLAWAGWGMGLLIERLGKSALAQTVGGLAFSLSGYLVARAHFLSINASVAWLPWILLASFQLAREPRRTRNILILAMVLAMQWLAGHAQIAWYTLLLALAWTAFWAWRWDRGHQVWRAALGFAAAGLLAFALSAAQLIPTAEYLLNSQRGAQVDFSQAATYSFWPWRVINAFAPNFFGNPAQGNYWGYGNYWEDAIYIGILPLLLAIAALWRIRRGDKERPLRIFLGLVIALSFLLALGNNLPLFKLLFQNIPSFSLFQGPTRFTIWLVFALALLAAYNVDAWRRPKGRALYWSRLAAAAAAGIVIEAGIALWLQSRDGISGLDTFAWASLSMGVFLLGTALLNLHAPRSKGRAAPRWGWFLAILIAVDLLYAGWGLNPGTGLDLYRDDQSVASEAEDKVSEGRLYMFADDEQDLKYGQLFHFDTFYSTRPINVRTSLLPNIGILDGIRSANNFDPLVPSRYQAWIELLQRLPTKGQGHMLQRMGVTWVTPDGIGDWANLHDSPWQAPRARWGYCSHVVDNVGEALDYVSSETYEATYMVIERVDGAADRMCDLPSRSVSSAAIVEESANRVAISVDSRRGGWLVVADTWYPGWRAFASGEEITIFPADGLFRAVYLERGEYVLEFVYLPVSFTIGSAISVLAGIALPVVWFWKRETR
ncbi:MAG: YfhO family protein [Anaerolineales bacterium]